ncbi:amino acid permease [Aurantibacter crassamenti]|uniref:APC family permease n=1 Tax=Aurantibacter crassamenti TaxID=1837375 RepID=UPI00193AA6D4|nr:APC family permease [Aurantibacter crassamenti]MBM1107256.1 amino acid permease [Aurantibacter crassamenti]
MNAKKEVLTRVVGVFGLSANIINIIVGSGIFVLPAIVAAALGASSIFAYLFCGVLIGLVMLCFAEAGSRLTASGGAYIFINTAFGPYFGFLTSVLFILASISADAAVANAVVDIAGSIFPIFKLESIRILMFLLFFGGFGYINVIGVDNGIKVVKFITIVKLTPLLILLYFSWGEISLTNLTITTIPTFSEVSEISLILFFAFQGAESSLSIGGEVKNPNTTIPKAIFFSILIILLLYILIQTVSQGVLGSSLPTFTENPLGEVAKKIFGPIGFTILTMGAAVSMIGYLCSAILSMPRVLYQSSIDKVLPITYLTKIHSKFKTPYISIITYAAMGLLFATLGGFEQLAIISSATILLIYLGVSLSVVKLRKIKGNQKNVFRIPGGIVIPILSSLLIIYLLTNLAQNEFVVILSVIIVLSLLYFIKRKSPIKG